MVGWLLVVQPTSDWRADILDINAYWFEDLALSETKEVILLLG